MACLKMNGKFCGFSPCIEQVQRTADALREAEFCDVRCIECILGYHDIRVENYATPIDACIHSSKPPQAAEDRATHKRTASEAGVDRSDEAAAAAEGPDENSGKGKSSSGQTGPSKAGTSGSKKGEDTGRARPRRLGRYGKIYVPWMSEHESVRRVVTQPRHVARGHTGYLLFARKPVKVESSESEDEEKEGVPSKVEQGVTEEGKGAAAKMEVDEKTEVKDEVVVKEET